MTDCDWLWLSLSTSVKLCVVFVYIEMSAFPAAFHICGCDALFLVLSAQNFWSQSRAMALWICPFGCCLKQRIIFF